MSEVAEYTRKDFAAEQEVRWCPGCGDYSILAQVQRVMPEICAETNLALKMRHYRLLIALLNFGRQMGLCYPRSSIPQSVCQLNL